MLYLEDYLEMIEHLPQELRDRFTEMRELDLQVQNATDRIDEKIKQFFMNAKRLKPELRDTEYDKINQEFKKCLEDSDEKIHIANQVHDLVERYRRRLDQELLKFKMELEADNAGITEILEKRSLELDLPPQVNNHNHHSSNKRKHASLNSYNATNGSEKRLTLCNEKGLPAFIPELNHDQLKIPNVTSHQSAGSSPFSSNGSPSPASSQAQLSYGLGHMATGSNAIAAAASQAIAATQQMQQGRRTASLKASFQAVNSTLQGINKEFSFGRDIAGTNPATAVAAAAAVAATGVNTSGSNSGLLLTSTSAQSRSASPAPETKSSGRQKSNRQSKLQTMLTQQEPEPEPESYQEEANGEDESTQEWIYDPDEPRYCICNQVSYGDMVACDNAECPVEWFHYNCVGITQPPRGKWYCPQCTSSMKRRGRK